MKKAKVINPPQRIFLQVGELDEDAVFDDLADGEVTWCIDKIEDTDIEYRLVRPSRYKRRASQGKGANDEQ
jgi:hypothetical protein